jgi:hypothetical protein
MVLVKTIGPDNSYVDYYQGVSVSRRGFQDCFGIRVEKGHCCAVAKVGDGQPFTYGNRYPLPLKIDTLASPILNILDGHLMNYPNADLIEVLHGKKSFEEAVNSSAEIEPKRMSATV